MSICLYIDLSMYTLFLQLCKIAFILNTYFIFYTLPLKTSLLYLLYIARR